MRQQEYHHEYHRANRERIKEQRAQHKAAVNVRVQRGGTLTKRGRPLSKRTQTLAAFTRDRRDMSLGEQRREWNVLYPAWAYDDVHFGAESRRAIACMEREQRHVDRLKVHETRRQEAFVLMRGEPVESIRILRRELLDLMTGKDSEP